MPQAIGNMAITALLSVGLGGLLPAASASRIGISTLATNPFPTAKAVKR